MTPWEIEDTIGPKGWDASKLIAATFDRAIREREWKEAHRYGRSGHLDCPEYTDEVDAMVKRCIEDEIDERMPRRVYR